MELLLRNILCIMIFFKFEMSFKSKKHTLGEGQSWAVITDDTQIFLYCPCQYSRCSIWINWRLLKEIWEHPDNNELEYSKVQCISSVSLWETMFLSLPILHMWKKAVLHVCLISTLENISVLKAHNLWIIPGSQPSVICHSTATASSFVCSEYATVLTR